MKTRFKGLIIILLGSVAFIGPNTSDAEDADPKQRTIPVRKWYVDLQRIGAQFQPGQTQVQTKEQRARLVEQVDQTQNGVVIEFYAQVKWKDGLATLTIGPMLKLPKSTSPKQPLKVTWTSKFEVNMPQEDAVAIKPGTRFDFLGKLEFHPNRHGAVGVSTKSQQLFSIQNTKLGGQPLGTFTSRHYSLQLNRETVVGKWADILSDSP